MSKKLELDFLFGAAGIAGRSTLSVACDSGGEPTFVRCDGPAVSPLKDLCLFISSFIFPVKVFVAASRLVSLLLGKHTLCQL